METGLSHLFMHIKFCHYCRHGADWAETKTKADYTIWNIYEGSLTMEINNKKFTASKGDILFFHPGDSYTALCNGCCCNFLVTFFSLDIGSPPDIFKQSNSAGIYSTKELAEASNAFCDAFFHTHRDNATIPMKLYSLFLAFMTELLPQLGTQEPFYDEPPKIPVMKLNRLLSYMEQHPEKNFPVKELASFMGMSEKYFIQFFHSHIGHSPKQYMINLKMNFSVKLLSEPALTLAEIASKLQYSDPYAFSKAFKKYYGESPGAFRKHYLTNISMQSQ